MVKIIKIYFVVFSLMFFVMVWLSWVSIKVSFVRCVLLNVFCNGLIVMGKCKSFLCLLRSWGWPTSAPKVMDIWTRLSSRIPLPVPCERPMNHWHAKLMPRLRDREINISYIIASYSVSCLSSCQEGFKRWLMKSTMLHVMYTFRFINMVGLIEIF